MVRSNGTPRVVGATCLALAMVVVIEGRAWAQNATDRNTGSLTLTGNLDVLNAYFFRGIPQDDTGVIMWPAVDLRVALFSGDGSLKSVGVNVGTWNSLHTGVGGSDGLGRLWRESRFYTTFGLGFGGGVNLGTTFITYTSPNNAFQSVREIDFKVSVDDSKALGAVAVRPYALLAFELPGSDGRAGGQADGGINEGKYLELGIAPGFSASGVSIGVPLKVGLSLGDYYEGLLGVDDRFGFFSIAGVVTKALSSASSGFGSWNIHGSVEYLRLGDRNALSYGDNNTIVGSIGIGFRY